MTTPRSDQRTVAGYQTENGVVILLDRPVVVSVGNAHTAEDHSIRAKDVARLVPETVRCITPKKQGDDPQVEGRGAGGLRAHSPRPFAISIGKWNDVGSSNLPTATGASGLRARQ
jgi:hypothetical protein